MGKKCLLLQIEAVLKLPEVYGYNPLQAASFPLFWERIKALLLSKANLGGDTQCHLFLSRENNLSLPIAASAQAAGFDVWMPRTALKLGGGIPLSLGALTIKAYQEIKGSSLVAIFTVDPRASDLIFPLSKPKARRVLLLFPPGPQGKTALGNLPKAACRGVILLTPEEVVSLMSIFGVEKETAEAYWGKHFLPIRKSLYTLNEQRAIKEWIHRRPSVFLVDVPNVLSLMLEKKAPKEQLTEKIVREITTLSQMREILPSKTTVVLFAPPPLKWLLKSTTRALKEGLRESLEKLSSSAFAARDILRKEGYKAYYYSLLPKIFGSRMSVDSLIAILSMAASCLRGGGDVSILSRDRDFEVLLPLLKGLQREGSRLFATLPHRPAIFPVEKSRKEWRFRGVTLILPTSTSQTAYSLARATMACIPLLTAEMGKALQVNVTAWPYVEGEKVILDLCTARHAPIKTGKNLPLRDLRNTAKIAIAIWDKLVPLGPFDEHLEAYAKVGKFVFSRNYSVYVEKGYLVSPEASTQPAWIKHDRKPVLTRSLKEPEAVAL